MAYIISVSMTEDNYLKLKNVENKSQLINQLLKDYFPKSFDIDEEVKKLELEKKRLADEESKVILKKREVQSIEDNELISKEQKKLKEFARVEKLKAMFKEDLGRDITLEELDDYLELDMLKQTNYFKFVEQLKKDDLHD